MPEQLSGFSTVLKWLQQERSYQQEKFDYASESEKDAEYWEQQFDSYIQRIRLFPLDSPPGKQAALKLAATSVALCEHLAEAGPLPRPGVPSGELERWDG